MRRARWMLLAGAGAAAALLLGGCGQESHWDDVFPGKPHVSHEWKPGFEVTSFEELYGTNCRGCHSESPPEESLKEGGLGAALPLNDPLYLAMVDDAKLTRIIAEGVEGTSMPPFAIKNGGTLTDEQIEKIVQGMRKEWGKRGGVPPETFQASLPPYEAPLGDPAAGKAAFGVYCASCHGADGTGGEGGQSVVDPDYLALISNQALRTVTIVGRKDFGMPDFTGYVEGKRMSNGEIADVVAWLASKRERVWKTDDSELANQGGLKPVPTAGGNPGAMPGKPYGSDPNNPPIPGDEPTEKPAPAQVPGDQPGATETSSPTPAQPASPAPDGTEAPAENAP